MKVGKGEGGDMMEGEEEWVRQKDNHEEVLIEVDLPLSSVTGRLPPLSGVFQVQFPLTTKPGLFRR